MSERHRAALVEGLIGDRGDLYLNSPTFHHSIEALADSLPLWINGIAVEAERVDREIQERIHKLMAGDR